ncbi:hypothetical protein UlMin_044542 [Ulmus minor]
MDMKLTNIAITLLVFFALALAVQSAIFDVSKLGAKPGGDVGQALTSAWKQACSSPGSNKLVVPKGIWKLNRASFMGPCKGPIEFQLDGTLEAPINADGFKEGDGWVTFEGIDRLTLFGTGTFDGQGENVWGVQCERGQYCKKLPMNVRFNFITNSVIRGITSLDSKQFHIHVLGNKNVTFEKITVIAPAQSHNTDGLHLGRSSNLTIKDSTFQTGDDCISIGDGTVDLIVERCTCGPGHGISIGSLGKYANEQPVERITIRNCTFKGTNNGVRIKTWTNAQPAIARDIRVEDIIVERVLNALVVDQEYCPWNQCNLDLPSRVRLSKLSFKNIRGTTTLPLAVNLVCSGLFGCTDVQLADIDLKYIGPGGHRIACECKNVKPTATGKMIPAACNARPGTTFAPDRTFQTDHYKKRMATRNNKDASKNI